MREGYMQQLVKYLKKNLTKGYPVESLKWALINQGYTKNEVNRAIYLTNEELAKEAPKLKEKPVIKIEVEPLYKNVKREGFISKLKRFFGFG